MDALRNDRFPSLALRQKGMLHLLALWGLLLAVLLQAGCASLPTDYPRSTSTALTDTGDAKLGQASSRLLAGHPDVSGVLLLNRGTDAFLARLALAEVAQRSLDIQYYIWHSDTTGKVLAAGVLHAAERGVRVRLLLDDIGTAADDRHLLALDSHPNIEVRLFNPIAARSTRLLGFVADFSRTNRRMHNKSFTADNQAMIVGGRNIGDEYFEARPDIEFADLDLLAIGPVVSEVSRQFDAYWNSPLAFPIAALSQDRPSDEAIRQAHAALREFVLAQKESSYAQALKSSGLAEGLVEGSLAFNFAKVRVVADDPMKVLKESTDATTRLLPKLLPEFEALNSELLLVSPYFVPGDAGVDRLRALVKRGVRVRVLTNSLASTDVLAVYAGYKRYRRALLEAGVELYELKPTAAHTAKHDRPSGSRDDEAKPSLAGSSHASLHAKTMAFDRRALFVGSMNLDPRSVFTNTEIGVVVEHPGLVAQRVETIDSRLPEISFRLELAPSAGPDSTPGIEWVTTVDGQEVRYSGEPMTHAWQRFKVWLYSLLPIEHLL
jgi:cardiolipin synthase C